MDDSTQELTAQEKHDQGLELTDADVAELEHGPAAAAAPQEPAGADEPAEPADTSTGPAEGASEPQAAAQEPYIDNGDGTYTRSTDGARGRFTPEGFVVEGA